jgi:hypothetical protein
MNFTLLPVGYSSLKYYSREECGANVFARSNGLKKGRRVEAIRNCLPNFSSAPRFQQPDMMPPVTKLISRPQYNTNFTQQQWATTASSVWTRWYWCWYYPSTWNWRLLYPSEANYVKTQEVSQLVYTAINLDVTPLQLQLGYNITFNLVPLKSFAERCCDTQCNQRCWYRNMPVAESKTILVAFPPSRYLKKAGQYRIPPIPLPPHIISSPIGDVKESSSASTKSTSRRRREEMVLSSPRSVLTTRRAQRGGVLFLCLK